ncbi:MAG: hypothetical protein HOV80_03780 [Polyangiaceae bacterium]|nr:hypothetical protein [Polyangiaceae bacterium]
MSRRCPSARGICSASPLGRDVEEDEKRAPRISAKTRVRAIAAAVLALLVLLLSQALPDKSEAGIAALLAREARVEVAPADYVWAPTGGAFADLFRGRTVVFLGRTKEGEPRDVYRAKVHLTIGGKPLLAHGAEQVTHTALGDEEGLEIVGGRALYLTRFQGKVQSVGVLDLEGGASRRVALPAPAENVEREAAPDALVLALPSGAASIAWDPGATVAAGGVRWIDEGSISTPALAARPIEEKQGSEPEVFPPSGAKPLASGDPSPVVEVAEGSGRIIALDGRQLELYLVDGTDAPGTQTGWVSGGAIPKTLVDRGVVAAIALPAAKGAGSFKSGAWSAQMAQGTPALAVSQEGRLLVGPWPFDAWIAPGVISANALAGLELRAADGAMPAWALCATAAGHLLVGLGVTDVSGSQWSHCISGAMGEGAMRLVGVESEGIDWATRALDAPTIVAVRSRYGPVVAAPAGEWAALALGQPTPAWMPAVRSSKTEVLGTTVEVTWIDPARFDWTIRAGTDERSHRMGGDFPEKLADADQARAKLSIGLGVGKRRSPRGLRIDGSTGHRFRNEGGLLLIAPGKISLLGTDRPASEPQDDGTELPVTVEDGELTTDARKRGPRQLRADLCVLPGGAFLAQATFDSHEATSTVLRDLGCRLVLALDRGSDRESWMSTEKPGPFETTALVGLDRALKGRVGSMSEVGGKIGP